MKQMYCLKTLLIESPKVKKKKKNSIQVVDTKI